MRRLVLLMMCFSAFAVQAQQRAVTETGDAVILYDDGTWIFEDEGAIEESEIQMNSRSFSKGKKNSFLVKSKKIDLGFWIDPKLWSFTRSTDNDEAEYELQLKGGDLYGMIITEKVEIPLKTLRTIAIDNGRDVAPDLHIVREEYRMVNDIKVLLLQMDGTMQGIKFSYYGYYYSYEGGTVQFITYTSQNLMSDYRSNSEDLLNGMVLLK